MDSKRFITSATFILVLALLIGGLYYPNAPIMWFASTSMEFTAVRVIALMALVVLLVTRPPRSLNVRRVLGVISGFLLLVSVGIVSNYTAGIMDALVFFQVALLLGIEALEVESLEENTLAKV